jgi:hypothetical protein
MAVIKLDTQYKNDILLEVFDMAEKAINKTTSAIKNTDLNAGRDKILKNGGLLTGAAIGGGGMLTHMLGDDHDIGASLIGAGVLGAAGAGVGHVIHNQFKKDDTPKFNDNFDYKKY